MNNALEIRGLTKAYPGFRLDGLDLTLPGGCIMGLIGENGAGKSTTIKLILGMIRKDSGTVKILGRDSSADEETADTVLTREDIGVVMDEVGIPECLNIRQTGRVMKNTFRNWDQTAYENLTAKFALPEGKAFKDFSRGMKMKTGIAVALSHGAKLLILDEATAGLDPVVRDEVVEMLSEFTREEDHSILISSHIVSDLEKLCDYVAFLHKGRLMLCEEKDVLLSEYGVIHCTAEQLAELPENAVMHKKENPYGVEAIVRREGLSADLAVNPVSIEELFVYMAREAE